MKSRITQQTISLVIVVALSIAFGGSRAIAEYAAKLAEAIPDAELVWIKDAGHWLIDEKPNEIGDRINQFLG